MVTASSPERTEVEALPPQTEEAELSQFLETPAGVASPEAASTETPPPPETPEVEAPPKDELQAFLEAEGLAGEPQASDGQSPEAAPEQRPDAVEVERRAAQLVAEREQARLEANSILSFRQAVPQIRQIMQVNGVDPRLANQVVNLVERINGYAKQVYTADAATVYKNGQYAAAEKLVPGISEDKAKHISHDTFLSDVVAKAREGYVPAKDADSIKKAAAVTAVEKLTKNEAALRAALSRLAGPRNANGNSTPSGAFDPETASLAEVNKRLAQLGL